MTQRCCMQVKLAFSMYVIVSGQAISTKRAKLRSCVALNWIVFISSILRFARAFIEKIFMQYATHKRGWRLTLKCSFFLPFVGTISLVFITCYPRYFFLGMQYERNVRFITKEKEILSSGDIFVNDFPYSEKSIVL